MNRKQGATGVSLLELMVATALLAVALVSIISVLISAMRLDNQTNEMAIAKQAAEFKLEQMRGYDFTTLVGMVTSLGGPTRHAASQPTTNANFCGFVENFAVQGIKVQPGDLDGMSGFCLVSRFAEGSTSTLLDTTGNNNLLRIYVRIDWRSNVGGNQTYELFGMRSDRGMNWTSN